MSLPNQSELLTLFSSFLIESGLSAVSIKNYLSDLRNFFRFLDLEKVSDYSKVFQNISKYINDYSLQQKTLLTPSATINRRLASIRRFSTFLKAKYSLEEITTQNQIDQNKSHPSSAFSSPINSTNNQATNFSSKKILDQFKQQLISEKKTHSTVKNYLSDLYHYFSWIANHTPYNAHHLEQILSNEQLLGYIAYLKLTHTSTSVISRRQSSIKKLTHYCFQQGFIPSDPFELVVTDTKIAPLSWLNRLVNKPKSHQNAPKGRLATIYYKYNSLSLTPYFHLALLVLATTTMALLGYNQVIKNAKPSSAATALTPPKRQLSFQGRLSDSGGTPINTSVNVSFKLWNNISGGSQLYTTGTCSVTPDAEGIFNTLIGDGVCGSEISQSVFADNRDVYLEVIVGAETLTPRQQIATVGYALNSETLQGYPASSAATINTVPVVDNSGNINIAATSPSIISTSGNFNIKGQSLSLTTATNSGGDIVLQPDSLASGQILAIGGTTTEDSFRVTNANLTSGSLISGYIGNNTATGSGNLLMLSSGATESSRFRITADGRTTISTATASANTAALIVDQNGTGNIFSASSSGISKFNINNSGIINTIDGVGHVIEDITGDLSLDSLGGDLLLGAGDNLQITAASNLIFGGTTSLAESTSAIDSGAYLVGTFDEFANSNSGNVQAVLNDLDDAIAAVSTSSIWLQNTGAIYSKNNTTDFLIGAQSTDSAKFAILNVNTGTPVASISSGLSGVSSFLSAAGILATTNNQTLTIGNSTTGNITLGTGSKNISIDSNTWDVTGAGVASGLTGITSSGTIRFTGLSASAAVYTDGSSNLTSIAPATGVLGFWQRNSGVIAPWAITDSVNIGATATASALVHLGGTSGEKSFFLEPVAIGFNSAITNPGTGGGLTALQVDGDILPGADDDAFLGRAGTAWNRLYLNNGISNTAGTEQLSILNRQLTGGQWNATTTLRVGDTTASMPTGKEFYVVGDASVSATLFIGGTSDLLGNVTIGNGTGKLDVGTVDPPYTINGEKYATYLSGMIGVKEEVTGNIITDEYLPNIGYRKTINFNNQVKGSDLWLFGKTTNLKQNLSRMSVLLTPQSQSKVWYTTNTETNTLQIYSSSPTQVSYRLTAPRFDDSSWTNTRTAGTEGFIINDDDIIINQNNQNESLSYSADINNIDGTYKLFINQVEKQEIANYSNSLIANLKVGLAVISTLVTDNLTIKNKLISPLADIENLNSVNATISGTLFADNIKGKTVDKLNEQLGLLEEKYSTASAILSSLQSKYATYSANLLEPLQLSPLSTTSATLPEDLALNTLSATTIITDDVLANSSIFTKSINSFDTDLFIQPGGDKSIHLLANLMTLYPNGQVVITGDLLVTGNIFANNLDTRTATVSGSLAIGTSSIDASGSANFGEVTTNGLIIAAGEDLAATISGQTNSNSTIGTASIATNSSEITIVNNKINTNTLIYITPISDTANQVLYVKSKNSCDIVSDLCNPSFTVAVPQPVTTQTSFNYWLVQTK